MPVSAAWGHILRNWTGASRPVGAVRFSPLFSKWPTSCLMQWPPRRWWTQSSAASIWVPSCT